MRKKICLLMAAAMSLSFATVAAGCGGGEGEGLVVWTFTDELGEMVVNYYKKNVDPDAEINVQTIPVNDLSTRLDSAWRAKKNLPDIVAIEEKYIRKYADAEGMFEPLDDMLAEDNGMYEYTLDAARNADGNIIAYAWQATPGALYYRTDMAEEILGVTSPEDM